jgi:hypothetical protein
MSQGILCLLAIQGSVGSQLRWIGPELRLFYEYKMKNLLKIWYVGKSCFTAYGLLRCIAEARPTTLIWPEEPHNYYQFNHNGVEYLPLNVTSAGCLDGRPEVMCFTDEPPHSVVFQEKGWQIIHVSSPDTSKYKAWVKRANAQEYFVDLWSWNEILCLWY